MLRFYWKHLKATPAVLWEAAGHAFALVGLLVFGVALFNRELAARVGDWDGVSPLWALAVVGIFFAVGIARRIYNEYAEADTLKAKLEQHEELVRLQKEEIAHWQKAFNVSQAQYKVFEGFYREQG